MDQERFRVRVTKDHLVFSAAHFITFAGNICERIHGHNWRVAAEIAGELDKNYYVFDFIALRDELQQIVDRLDHRILLPTKHATIKVIANDRETEVTFEDRRWVFPRDDCQLLPIENTTAELIARWIAGELLQVIRSKAGAPVDSLRIEVEENFGQWAIYEMDL